MDSPYHTGPMPSRRREPLASATAGPAERAAWPAVTYWSYELMAAFTPLTAAPGDTDTAVAVVAELASLYHCVA